MSAAKNWFGSGQDSRDARSVIAGDGKEKFNSYPDDVAKPYTKEQIEAARKLSETEGQTTIERIEERAEVKDREAVKRVLEEELSKLRAENEKLKAVKGPALRLKVSDKGAVSLYGLGRFPVTLYASQWEKLLGMKGEVEKFVKEHKAELSFKEQA